MGRLDISVFKSIDFLGKGAFWSTRHPVPFHIGEIDFAHVHVYEPARVKEHVVEECEQLWFLYSRTMKLSPSPRIEYGVPLRTQKAALSLKVTSRKFTSFEKVTSLALIPNS